MQENDLLPCLRQEELLKDLLSPDIHKALQVSIVRLEALLSVCKKLPLHKRELPSYTEAKIWKIYRRKTLLQSSKCTSFTMCLDECNFLEAAHILAVPLVTSGTAISSRARHEPSSLMHQQKGNGACSSMQMSPKTLQMGG